MSDIKSNMSIPDFLNLLDLEQLENAVDLANAKIELIKRGKKVKVYVFRSGFLNEGFYRTKEEAVAALKRHVNSSGYFYFDKLDIIEIYEYPEEAERLFEDYYFEI